VLRGSRRLGPRSEALSSRVALILAAMTHGLCGVLMRVGELFVRSRLSPGALCCGFWPWAWQGLVRQEALRPACDAWWS